MVGIESSLARAQLGAAVFVGLLAAGISALLVPQATRDVAFGAGCVVTTYVFMWPLHVFAATGGRRALMLEMAFVPIRLGILVALALVAIDNVARPGAPFALGIAITVIAGSFACLWVCAKDPRYHWVTPAKPYVLRTRQQT
ncbi:hypothetical protein [Stomatohabitans albus]|uniref:hypothetical protein n=1 Tax=Stomatohabitans albus TaxID=3110766 RepID=UPI00300D37C0